MRLLASRFRARLREVGFELSALETVKLAKPALVDRAFRLAIWMQVIVCILSLFVSFVPGWKMFASVGTTSVELRDSKGERVSVRSWLPHPAYGPSNRPFKESSSGPWVFPPSR